MSSTCPLCNDKELVLTLNDLRDLEYGAKGSFCFKSCPACGLHVLWPMPSLEDLKTYYPPDYHGFHTSEAGIISYLYRLVYYCRFKEYERLIGKSGRLIDVGCGDAPYFDLLKEQCPKIDSTGVEFKDEIATRGREKGRNIITGTLMDIDAEETFDLVIMNNLIEHVIDPVEELKKAWAVLKPGGYIILETPNIASLDYKLTKKFWGGLHVPRHTYLFSPFSLKLLASQTGFKIERTLFLLNTDHWALSVQNYLQSTSLFCTTLKNGRTWYYKYLLFAFIPLNFIQLILKKTGSCSYILKKS